MSSATRAICANCGHGNEVGARACESCGATLAPAGARESRKVVTVLFSDVQGSTALGQELDPESLRGLMQRYFDEMRTVLERHGGTVEKFIGDAVMAVFGVPQVHEDDALRAVRAAVDMRAALARLNGEFERSWGVAVAARIGVNTGEVIAGDPGTGHTFVVGEPVNLAARLEQSAQPGEILIGPATERLVRDAVELEEAGPLDLKGIGAPVATWRVLDVDRVAVAGWARSDDAPLVGRARELDLLAHALARATERHGCELVTVMGPAGVGKSRLLREFLAAVGDHATVVTGRCLPYGEGITFWPIVGVVREAAGIKESDAHDEARAKLSALLPPDGDGPLVEERLASLLGDDRGALGIQETFWAVRKLLEHLASRRPLVVVLDDIQWGERTFLDLLEYLTDWIGGAPVLLACIARPELDEVRPGWSVGKPSASRIVLEPLTGTESEGLITNLLGGGELDPEARARIAEVAEGNPLFLEQTLRMLVDEGLLRLTDGGWEVMGDLSAIAIPPTIHAVLTARLDRLQGDERRTVERAAVVGRVFWWGAVVALSPDEQRAGVGHALQALTRKGLIRPDRTQLGQEDAFRFSHILVRDAAYGGIPKAARAELHERLAEWAASRAVDLAAGQEEIVGYHLEQAYRAQVELGVPQEQVEALGRRAAASLGGAGRRAFARGDMPAAVNLLTRAESLLARDDPQRLELLPQLAFALLETGDFERLVAVATEATEAAATGDSAALRAHAVILNLWIRLFTDPVGWAEEAEKEATAAAAAFEELGDERGLTKAWSLLGLVSILTCRFGPAEHAWRTAAEHAGRAGDRRDELDSLAWVPLMIWAGPTETEAGLARCRELRERVGGDKKAVASALIGQAVFEAGLGHIEEARKCIGHARALLSEAALTVWLSGPLAQFAGWAELLAGDPEAAERELRAGYDVLTEIGEVAWLSTVAALLGEAVLAQGRLDEAEELTRVSEGYSGPDDVYSHTTWRAVRAKVAAGRGDADEAERLAREAAALAETGDFLHLRWFAQLSLARVLAALGEEDEAKSAALAAAASAEEKGSLVGVRTALALAESLGEPPAVPAS